MTYGERLSARVRTGIRDGRWCVMAKNGEGEMLLYRLEERVYGEVLGAIRESGAPEQVQHMWSDRAMSSLNTVQAALHDLDGLEREVRELAGHSGEGV